MAVLFGIGYIWKRVELVPMVHYMFCRVEYHYVFVEADNKYGISVIRVITVCLSRYNCLP
jgi:hypothetical protein